MPDDLDHEVIDSPQALFRHLYEAHGLVEALDLDPATAPLQFWLRKHAELERSPSRAVVQDRTATVPDRPPASGRHLLPRRSTAEGGSVGLSLGTPTAALATPPPAGRGAARSRGPANPGATTGQGSGPRFRPFADPLVEAVAAALVARGLDERQVRRGLSSFTGVDGRHGEDAVRAAFIAPMLEALAAELARDPRGRARRPQPPPASPARDAASPRPPAAQRDGAAPRTAAAREGAGPSASANLSRQGPLAARGVGPEPDVDYMAIADVLQERRRSRRGGQREPAAPPRTTPPAPSPPAPSPPASGPPSRPEADDDFMALADALRRRHGDRQR